MQKFVRKLSAVKNGEKKTAAGEALGEYSEFTKLSIYKKILISEKVLILQIKKRPSGYRCLNLCKCAKKKSYRK